MFEKGIFLCACPPLSRLLAVVALLLMALAAPAAPPAAPPDPAPLEVYGRLPTMSMPVLSPSGDRFAFIAELEGQRRLFVRTVAGEPLAMAAVDEIKPRGLTWAGDRFVLLQMSDTVVFSWTTARRHELVQIVVLDLNTGELRPLISGGRYMNATFGFYGVAQQNGDWSAYVGARPLTHSGTSNKRYLDGPYLHLVAVDLATGRQRMAARGRMEVNRGYDDWLLSPQGDILAHATYETHAQRWTLHAGTGSKAPVRLQLDDPLSSTWLLGQGRTAGTALISHEDTDGRRHYAEVPLQGDGGPEAVFTDHAPRAFVFDPHTGVLNGWVEEGDHPQRHHFDDTLQARLDAIRRAFPHRHVRFLNSDDEGERFIVYTDGRDDAGSWWLVDVPGRSADPLGEAYPRLQGDRVGPVRMFPYTASDGLPMAGVLTLPPGRKAEGLPVIALPHGGPEVRDYPAFDWLAQAFASRGFAVWQPNFRGSAGYGADFRNAGHGEWGARMQTDISDGIDALAEAGIVDATRACIVGASYGGYAALAGVTLQQGRYRCAVSLNGIAGLQRFVDNTRSRYRDEALRYWQRFMGAEDGFDEILEARSPITHAAQTDAPVLLIHGRDDTVVDASQSRRMASALKRADKPVTLKLLKGEDHWLSREETRIATLETAVGFVLEHLPPSPSMPQGAQP